MLYLVGRSSTKKCFVFLFILLCWVCYGDVCFLVVVLTHFLALLVSVLAAWRLVTAGCTWVRLVLQLCVVSLLYFSSHV